MAGGRAVRLRAELTSGQVHVGVRAGVWGSIHKVN